MRKAGIAPLLIGKEETYKRHVDENVDHVRSFPGSWSIRRSITSGQSGWMESALAEAKARAEDWRVKRSGGISHKEVISGVPK
jgi:hypothetical protein